MPRPTAGAGADGATSWSAQQAELLARRWGGTVLAVGAGCTALWGVTFSIYFGGDAGTMDACDSAADARSRTAMHWLAGTAPLWARNALLLAMATACCQKLSDIEGQQGLGQALLLGAGVRDGSADSAGWLAIVGTGPRRQSTWAEALAARGFKSTRQALASAATKFFLWHWSQPVAYLWLCWVYRCYVAELGPTQTHLAAVVAAREILYLGSTLLAVIACPVFLLLDLRTVWNEAETPLQRFTRLAMYVLCPHNFAALVLAKRFPRWARVFYCLAAVQVLADLSSCYALANLIASDRDIKASQSHSSNATADLPADDGGIALQQDVAPLQIGYSITAFGFLLFFGPLSVASSVSGALDRAAPPLLQLGKAAAAAILLVAWLGIMVLMGWLIVGGNPFCSGLPLLDFSCSGHGQCFGASECVCDTGFGPESKLSGTALCSCKAGFIDGSNGQCDHPTGCDRPNPCLHGGTCRAVGGSYSCACPTGWRGKQDCGQPTGCDDSPCENGGSCTTTDGALHTCACPEGWSGAQSCDHPTGCDGASGLCLHGGTCHAHGGSHTCSCASGWSGKNCSHPTGCDDSPCKNGGSCTATATGGGGGGGGSHTCVCAEGWSGDQSCNHPTGCDDDPCEHGGSCTADGGAHVCICAAGWSGDQACDQQLLPGGCGAAIPPDCGHGICVPHEQQQHSCSCNAGWGGPSCVTGQGFASADSHVTGVTTAGKTFVEAALPPELKLKHWTLCYDSRTNCTTHASCFHRDCDRHDETIVLGHNSLGFTFGGFAQASWEGSGDWATEASGDFIFRLISPQPESPATVYRPTGTNNEYQYQDSSAWPNWGSKDLVFGLEAVLGAGGYAKCSQGATYQGAPDDACGGRGGWGATEMEVWFHVQGR